MTTRVARFIASTLRCTPSPVRSLYRPGIAHRSHSMAHHAAAAGDTASAARHNEQQNATEFVSHDQYKTDGLTRDNLNSSALVQFRSWLQDAIAHPDIPEPEAMTISTVALVPSPSDASKTIARPSSRVVLLKKIDDHGFIFYSNYQSRKGRELAANPFISLTFYWHALHRSVRVCGRTERLSHADNDRYFNSRPLGSRIGAIASPQSTTIANGQRDELEKRVRDVEQQYSVPGAAGLDASGEQKYDDRHIPVPEYWGGFRVIPDEVEFWMGRSNRLHDRFRYTRDLSSDKVEWQIDRLAP